MPRLSAAVVVLTVLLAWPARHASVAAQGTIPPECRPPAPAASKSPIIFSDEQESDLGDVIDERVGREFQVIDDDEATGYLRRMGARIVAHLPPSKLRFQFFLIDLPDANAFAMPGGRIYVSRKLIALAKDEDELAGVLGHEAGHLIARQQAAFYTKVFKDVIGVTSVGDRADIFEKYNRFMDNVAKASNVRRNEDTEQIEADQIGLFAVTSAGYDPAGHARLMDRIMGTKGKTGSFFSDLFGTTNPDSVRLREILKNAKAVPPSCVDARAADPAAFETWRSSIITFNGLSRKESVPGVLSRTVLDPPLRGEIVTLRFSPDGRTVLAQDDGGISVLSREPFQVLFHIDATGVAGVQFTSDSRQIVFNTYDNRVERWDVASKKLLDVQEVHLTRGCLQVALSPNGRLLACVEEAKDFPQLTLELIDVATAEPVQQFKELTTATPYDVASLAVLGPGRMLEANFHWMELAFSPDGRFLLAGKERGGFVGTSTGQDVLLYDFETRQPVALKGDARKFIAAGFAFTGPDTVAAVNKLLPKESAIVHLPDGAITEKLTVFDGNLESATKGAFIFVRPFQKFSVGVLDLAKKAVVKGLPNAAIDMYGDVFVAERGTGELGLYGLDNQVRASVTLPRASLTRVRAAAVSEDFKWIAVSSRARGMLWDAAQGKSMTQTREFSAAMFSSDDVLIADFPKAKEEPHQLMKIDPAQRTPPTSTPITDGLTSQIGSYLMVRSPAKKGTNIRDGEIIEVRDVATGASLWTKTYAVEPPELWTNQRGAEALVLAWPMTSKTAKDEAKKDPKLAKSPALAKPVEDDHFIRVIDMRTGSVRAQMIFESGGGSFALSSAIVVGDVLTVADSQNRVRLYSLTTGDSYGRVFGSRATVSPTGKVFSVENGPGKLTIYDVATFKKRESYVFSHNVTLTRFSADGAKLFVLTSDQTAYVIQVPK